MCLYNNRTICQGRREKYDMFIILILSCNNRRTRLEFISDKVGLYDAPQALIGGQTGSSSEAT